MQRKNKQLTKTEQHAWWNGWEAGRTEVEGKRTLSKRLWQLGYVALIVLVILDKNKSVDRMLLYTNVLGIIILNIKIC